MRSKDLMEDVKNGVLSHERFEEMIKAEKIMDRQDITVSGWHELATEALKQGHIVHASFPVNGSSMEPFIRYHRDEVVVEPVTRPLRRGDIVLFEAKRLGGDYVLHQVWKMQNGVITTFGYNCRYPDVPIPEEKVIGVAVEVRRGKRIIRVNGWQWRTATNLWMRLPAVRKCCMAISQIARRGCRWLRRQLKISSSE